MHFVTANFLDQLTTNAASSSELINDIHLRKGVFHLDIEVISSLGLPETPVDASAGDQKPVEDLFRRLVDLRGRFRPKPKDREIAGEDLPDMHPDLIVSCGDLVQWRQGPAAGPDRAERMYRDICLPFFRRLTADSAGRTSDILSIPGEQDIRGEDGRPRGTWGPNSGRVEDRPYYRTFVSQLVRGVVPPDPHDHPVVSIFRVYEHVSAPEGLANAPLAHVAVIGFDSNEIRYHHDLSSNHGQISEAQLQQARELIRRLRSFISTDSPLYIVAVTHHGLLPGQEQLVGPPLSGDDDPRRTRFLDTIDPEGKREGICTPDSPYCLTQVILAEKGKDSTTNAARLIRDLQDLKVSLLVQASMLPRRSVMTVVSTSLEAGSSECELPVFGAPSVASERSTSGLSRIQLDLWKGETHIDVAFETEADGTPASSTRPVQIRRPLLSASRISTGERRLYSRVCDLVRSAGAPADPSEAAALRAFRHHARTMWIDEGYATVSMPDGSLPASLGDATRQSRYFLLLLLRQTSPGNYEILLSRHNPTRRSDVTEWDTLLMPAFSSVRNLMERLRFDIDRQADRTEDLERAIGARRFDAAVERLQVGAGNLQDDIWLDNLRELGLVKKRKISPTTGLITEYEYRLVILTPFVRDSSQDSDQERVLRHDEQVVVSWFSDLPRVRPPGTSLDNALDLPLAAIQSRGTALRWDPASEANETKDGWADEAPDREVGNSRVYPPGSVWFPLPQITEPPWWMTVPSIVARNADVMVWVDKQLADRRRGTEYPASIVMGRMVESADFTLAQGPFAFSGEDATDSASNGSPAEPVRNAMARSSHEAMRRVQYNDELDLKGEYPYRDNTIGRVALVRRTITLPNGNARDAICVFEGDVADRREDLERFHDADLRDVLGLLRPTQRYVLEAGLTRAVDVNRFLAAACPDPWGFVRATYLGAGEPVALTTPIIEKLMEEEEDGSYWVRRPDGSCDFKPEFLVCDGNHRIVQKVWIERGVAPAIGVLGRPSQPYYAQPFSPYEWRVTAENRLNVTPDTQSKYTPRLVDIETVDATVRADFIRRAGKEPYRRYFRDLASGFGSMGGQGGRFV